MDVGQPERPENANRRVRSIASVSVPRAPHVITLVSDTGLGSDAGLRSDTGLRSVRPEGRRRLDGHLLVDQETRRHQGVDRHLDKGHLGPVPAGVETAWAGAVDDWREAAGPWLR